MSDTFASEDPFALNALDEETELRALEHTLQLSDGFALIFARCNQPQQRKRLVETLRKDLPELVLQEISFTESIVHLLDELRGRIADGSPGAIFVSGLEYSFPSAADAHLTPLIANLNAARNSFPGVIKSPLVLWVADFVLTAIARGAPDFFSIRSGVYYFAATPQETDGVASSLTSDNEISARSLSLAEKQERVRAIEALLSDYQALPDNQRDHRTESRLHSRLGTLFSSLGRYAAAIEHFENAATLAKQSADVDLEASALHGAGLAYFVQGQPTEAEAAFARALELSRQSSNRANESTDLNSLGNVYFALGRLEDAEKMFQESLAIYRDLKDQSGEALSLGNLGRIYATQQRWEEAESDYKESLAVLQRVGDRDNEASGLYNLAHLYSAQGRIREAQTALEQAAQIAHEVGNRVFEGGYLVNLALLYSTQGDLDAALKLGRRALSILETAERTPVVEWAQETIANIERQAVERQESSKHE